MFVKTTNGQIETYPYTVGDLRRDHPHTSFPKRMPDDLLASYGVYPVEHDVIPAYDPRTERVHHADMPELKDGKWVLTKTVVPLTEAQAAAVTERLTKEAEAKRAEAYRQESDPIFFKWQRGSATQQEWLDAVAAIKARYPDPE